MSNDYFILFFNLYAIGLNDTHFETREYITNHILTSKL